ncbi:MAG: hypothetical protein ACR2HY_04690 [Acidimicrobiales bacterium]
MADLEALDALVALLDAAAPETMNTSMRLPVSLRDAAAIAVERLGAAPSTTALASEALRRSLETIAMRAALDAHYEAYPRSRPSLAEVALAAAEQDGDSLAAAPEAIRRAAEEVIEIRPDADADDVLLWAKAKALTATP